MIEAECPYCERHITFSRYPKRGQKVTCPYCGEKLKVIHLNPLELDSEYYEEDDQDDHD